jgi:hypothetical protein
MDPQIGLAHPALLDMDVYVLALASDPRVDGGVAADERGDSAGAPHASGPPSRSPLSTHVAVGEAERRRTDG